MIDHWRGLNEGTKTVIDALDSVNRSRLQQLQEGLLGQQLETAQLGLDEKRQEIADKLALRTGLASVQPTYTEQVTEQINPERTTWENRRSAAMSGPQQPADSTAKDILSEFGTDPAVTLPTAQEFEQTYPAPAATVTQKTVTERPPAYSRVLMQHALKTGNLEMLGKAKELAQIEGEMQAAGVTDLSGYYTATAKASLSKTQSDQLEKGMKAISELLDKGGTTAVASMQNIIKAIPGFESFDAAKLNVDPSERFFSYDAGNGQTIIVDREHPKDWKLEKKDPVTDFAVFASGFRQEHPGATDADVSRAWEAKQLARAEKQRQIVVNNPLPAKININGLTAGENAALDRAIGNGLDPYKVNSRTAKIYAQQEMLNPGRKWNELGAQAAFERSQPTMQTKALLNTIDPLLTKLEQAGGILGNSSLPGYNRAVNYLKEQTGSSDIVGFNNLRDDVVAEVERGLLGTGVLSDSKYNRAIKNVNSAQSLPQLKAAIANTRAVIQARLEALKEGPFPSARSATGSVQSGRFSVQEVK